MIYQHNRVSEEAGALYNYEDLMTVQWQGDNKMETFIPNWDMVLEGCGDDVDLKTVRFLFLKQLRLSAKLKPDLNYYDRIPANHEDKTYDFLRGCVRRHIELNRLKANRAANSEALKQGVPDKQALAAKGKGEGKDKKKKGKGKKKGKDRSRSPSTDGSQSDTSSNSSSSSRSDRGGKDKGKGEKLCWFFNTKMGCNNGASCPFKHVKKTALST